MSRVRHSVDGYAIDRPVARGRSGQVYRALSPWGEAVALKVHDRSPDAATEIACLQAVDHVRLVELVDSGQSDAGESWLALRWIEGETLAHLLATEEQLSLERTRTLVDAIASGIDAIHDAGYVHGDLAPSNIIVGPDDRVTIIDFATARRVDDVPPSIDQTSGIELETTPRYASPEIAQGRSPEPASDIYALALITYEALTATTPFPEVVTPIAMLAHHASSMPDAPTEHRPDIPGAVEDALLAGLAKHPDDRPQSAGEFARHLRSDAAGDGSRRDSQGLGLSRVALAVLVAGLLASVLLVRGLTTDSALASFNPVPGEAARTACNLVTLDGFEGPSLPDTYYSGDLTNTVLLAPGAGLGESGALRVGSNGAFGVFGEIVPIGSERSFVFSAWMRQQGEPGVATFYVDYLDENFDELTAARTEAIAGSQHGTTDGTRAVIQSQAPAGAAYAVPTFFKDGSGGSLLVDEVVFGAGASCPSGLGS